MAKVGKYLPLMLVVLIGLLFQEMFIFIDQTDSPRKATIEFSRAYYLLDVDSMSGRLCNAYRSSDVVDDYIYRVAKAASDRGFQPKYLKSRLFHIETHILQRDDNKAKVRLTAKRRTSIHPVYEYVGKLFCIGQTYTVDEVIDLVKEKDQWKVCGQLFNLT